MQVGTINSSFSISFSTDIPLTAWTALTSTTPISVAKDGLLIVIRIQEDQFFYYAMHNNTGGALTLEIEGPCYYAIVTNATDSTIIGLLDSANTPQLVISPLDIDYEAEEAYIGAENMTLVNLDLRKYFNIV